MKHVCAVACIGFGLFVVVSRGLRTSCVRRSPGQPGPVLALLIQGRAAVATRTWRSQRVDIAGHSRAGLTGHLTTRATASARRPPASPSTPSLPSAGLAPPRARERVFSPPQQVLHHPYLCVMGMRCWPHSIPGRGASTVRTPSLESEDLIISGLEPWGSRNSRLYSR